MKFRDLLIIGITIRIILAPFVAHPYDVYDWLEIGNHFLTGSTPVQQYLVPYNYSFFLFVFPASFAFKILSVYIPNFSFPTSSLNPALVPRFPVTVPIIPGLLFDLLVKLPLIASDTVVSYLLYKLVLNHSTLGNKNAIYVAGIWILNPLVIWISSGWGMMDTLPTLFSVAALYYVFEGKPKITGLMLSLSIAMKFYAIALVVPLMFISYRTMNRRKSMETLAVCVLASILLFVPSATLVLKGFATLGTSNIVTGSIHYSGDSFWTLITLFWSQPYQGIVSAGLVLLSELALIAYFFIRKKDLQVDLVTASALFAMPLVLVLLLYQLANENFFVWLIPFLTILTMEGIVSRKLYWGLSTLLFVSSITDTFLPFYLLPLSPWIGGSLVYLVNLYGPYAASHGGNLETGINTGKVVLATLGALTGSIMIILSIRMFSTLRKKSVLHTN